MSGHIIRNTGSAVTVEMPSGERVEAPSVVAALGIVEHSRSLQQEGFGQINTLDFRTDAEKADGLKISRIDLQARLGDDFLCGECLIQFGKPDCRCSGADRSGQDSLPHPVPVQGHEGRGEAAQGQRSDALTLCGSACAGICSAEGEGE